MKCFLEMILDKVGGWLPVGAGIEAGPAFVGNVGSGEVKDFTALGDTINTGARLAAAAGAGELVVGQKIYAVVGGSYPDAQRHILQLKGKEGPSEAYYLRRSKASEVAPSQ